MNGTAEQETYYVPVYHTLLLLLAVLVLLTNTAVIVVYKRNYRLATTTNFLLVHLTACDLLRGAVGIPLVVVAAVFGKRIRGGLLTLYFISNATIDLLAVATVLSLTLVIGERYMSLCHPYKHERSMSKRRIYVCLVLVWLLALAVALTPLLWSLGRLRGGAGSAIADEETAYMVHSLITLVVCYFAPALLILFALLRMYVTVHTLIENTSAMSIEVRKKRERRLLLIFTTMFTTMMVLWTPLMTVRLLLDLGVDLTRLSPRVPEAFMVMHFLSSITNTIIYVWMKKDFRHALSREQCIQAINKLRQTGASSTKMSPKGYHSGLTQSTNLLRTTAM